MDLVITGFKLYLGYALGCILVPIVLISILVGVVMLIEAYQAIRKKFRKKK